jgi:hypothetical protein
MGAEIAIRTSGGQALLNNFADNIVAKMHLEEGNWVIFGRVFVRNLDSDRQYATVRLVHDANIDLDTVVQYPGPGEIVCYSMHGMLTVREKETVTLNCNSYFGIAQDASVVAIKVDAISIV